MIGVASHVYCVSKIKCRQFSAFIKKHGHRCSKNQVCAFCILAQGNKFCVNWPLTLICKFSNLIHLLNIDGIQSIHV